MRPLRWRVERRFFLGSEKLHVPVAIAYNTTSGNDVLKKR